MSNQTKVLTVERPSLFRRSTSITLRAQGYSVTTASDCESALNKMVEYMDVIVVDVSAETFCPEEAVMNLRRRAPHVPVVVVAEGQRIAHIKGRTTANFMIPEGEDTLVETIHEAYNRARRLRAARAAASASSPNLVPAPQAG